MPVGQIVHGALVEAAVIDTARAQLPTYLRALETQLGIDADSLPDVRAFTTANALDNFPEDQLPAVVAISTGIIGSPERQRDGYRARWAIALAVITSASTQDATNTLSKLYAAALRAAIVQHPTLGGLAQAADWVDETYAELALDDQRSIAAAVVGFAVDVVAVTDPDGRPDPGVAVASTAVAVEPRPLTEPLGGLTP